MDWSAVDAFTDEQIEAAAAKDPDAASIRGEDWFKDAELLLPGRKRPISIRFDPEVMDYFTAGGPGYQSRMNAVLLQYVRHQRAREIAQRLTGAKSIRPTDEPAGAHRPDARLRKRGAEMTKGGKRPR